MTGFTVFRDPGRSARPSGRAFLALGMVAILCAVAYSQTPAAPPAATGSCPGQQMPVQQATGTYTPRPVPDIVINGQPAPGAFWKAGERAYWHCHTGSQILMVDEGVGAVQQRGQRVRILRRGQTEFAGPGVEHWHGATQESSAHYFQTTTTGSVTLWMEEVGRDDYSGNDIGINSRNEFLKTGIKKKTN